MREKTATIPPIYCQSFQNESRRARLQSRMDQLGLACTFLSTPPTASDVRAMIVRARRAEPPGFEYRTVAVMLGHLQLIRRFVDETSASHGVFCEDDIYLRRTMRHDLPSIVHEFEARQLDVLLLGYLWPWREGADDVDVSGYRFHDYGPELWGSQMYMLSRRQAIQLLATYTLDYALAHWSTQPFAADWIITKVGRRARLAPMLAVEEGDVATTNAGQVEFHRRCVEAQYDPALYL